MTILLKLIWNIVDEMKAMTVKNVKQFRIMYRELHGLNIYYSEYFYMCM
jgi:hypothetical protein